MGIGQAVQPVAYTTKKPTKIAATAEIPFRIRHAFAMLVQAREYAESLDLNLWDLAVELPELRQARVTHSDLRWLACKGFVDYANEVTTPDDLGRQFQAAAPLLFIDSTCFVLTDAGLALMRESSAHRVEVAQENQPISIVFPLETNFNQLLPEWDSLRRQLRVDRVIVKEFKLPSPNQEAILMAFEEECWAARIDDPLIPIPEIDPRRRLHDTIKALNRNQKQRLIRFMGDGSGEGIRWELIPQPGPAPETRDGQVGEVSGPGIRCRKAEAGQI